MTLDDMTLLADIMRGRDVSSESLAERLVVTYRDLERAKAELKAARAAARRRPRRHVEVQLKSLEQRLVSKEKALAFSIARQEVLRRQLTEALGPKASRPKHTLERRSA